MNNPDHRITEGKGKWGNAFEFGEKSNSIIFYKGKDNIVYHSQSWPGTILFWLSADPSTDLDGYTDPIQITDTDFNDASIWVDFTDEDPCNFRLGIIGDRNAWTLDTLNSSISTVFEKRTVSVKKLLFTKSTWSHILIVYDSLASLYLNGEKMGAISRIDDPFTRELRESKIFLGLNFTGLMYEFSIFNKPLTEDQERKLYQVKEWIKSMLWFFYCRRLFISF